MSEHSEHAQSCVLYQVTDLCYACSTIDTGSSFSGGCYELGCISAFIYQDAAKVV